MKTRNPTVRRATAVALAVGAYLLVVDLLLQPLYHRGVEGPACPVFISRGVGHTVLPVRVGIPPEIAVIELTRA